MLHAFHRTGVQLLVCGSGISQPCVSLASEDPLLSSVSEGTNTYMGHTHTHHICITVNFYLPMFLTYSPTYAFTLDSHKTYTVSIHMHRRN